MDKSFWVKPSSRENLVMTSPYKRPSVRIDPGGGGGESQGNPNGVAQVLYLFLGGKLGGPRFSGLSSK